MSEHPADIDLLRAADGAPPSGAADHLDRCAECKGRVAEARALAALARRGYGEPARETPSASLERRLAEIDRRALAPAFARRRLWAPLAMAAAVLLGVTLIFSGGGSVEVRAWAIVPDHPAGVRDPGAPIARARSGEAYRIQVVLEDSGSVSLFNLDTSGALHLFFPFRLEGDRLDRFGLPETFERGARVEIPPATHDPFVLDDVAGTETYFLLASPRALEERALLETLREHEALPPAGRTADAVGRRLEERFEKVRTLTLEHVP